MVPERIEKIAILGGGTAGWIVAAALSHTLKHCEITLIESEEIGTVGVGEATIPPILNFLNYLGIQEQEFMAFTEATYKLGIKFQDWKALGAEYWHPFGNVGVNIDNKPFFPYWLKSFLRGNTSAYSDYCPAAVMAQNNKFYPFTKAPKESFLASTSYAYHFDAGLVAKFLRKYSENKGVNRIEGRVVDAVLDETGFIKKLLLDSKEEIFADLFIDCSGFKGLLIDKVLNSNYEDWSDFLPCDRAIAVPTSNTEKLSPYTVAHAREAGWTWQIPLMHRTGNGYVYASKFCSDEEARNTLLKVVKGNVLAEPRVLQFTTGRRKQMWKQNCISIGLSAGFIEPLESTAIQLIIKGVRTLIELFPMKDCNPALVKEYNRLLNTDYENIRDFVVLHYCMTKRTDTPFWQWCADGMRIPESLKDKMTLYKTQGHLQWNPLDLFREPSWHAVFLGMGLYPNYYDSKLDGLDFHKVEDILKQLKGLMYEMASGLPDHQNYLKENQIS